MSRLKRRKSRSDSKNRDGSNQISGRYGLPASFKQGIYSQGEDAVDDLNVYLSSYDQPSLINFADGLAFGGLTIGLIGFFAMVTWKTPKAGISLIALGALGIVVGIGLSQDALSKDKNSVLIPPPTS